MVSTSPQRKQVCVSFKYVARVSMSLRPLRTLLGAGHCVQSWPHNRWRVGLVVFGHAGKQVGLMNEDSCSNCWENCCTLIYLDGCSSHDRVVIESV